MEPGLRDMECPWDAGLPAKPWRFTTPWKPRPFVTPMTRTLSPTSKIPTVSSWPATYSSPSSGPNSRTSRGAASSPAFAA